MGSRSQATKTDKDAAATEAAGKPAAKKPKKSAVCKTCGKRIVFRPGWGVGASVRRHYWRRHPEVMRGER